MDQQKPSIGRIVHYVAEGGKVLPAIVVAVFGDCGTCNLQVFLDGSNSVSGMIGAAAAAMTGSVWRTSCSFDDSEEPRVGTWHWPPRD